MQRAAEIRAAGALAAEAMSAGVAVVGDMHQAIIGGTTRRLPRPLRSPARLHAAAVAATYTAVDRIAGLALRAGAHLAAGRAGAVPSQTPLGRAVQPVVNGMWGDIVTARRPALAAPMAVHAGGRTVAPDVEGLAAAFPGAARRVAVFVHGLVESERSWWTAAQPSGPPTSFGHRLAEELALTPVYLRYTSGLALEENARALARLLDELHTAWPVPVHRIDLVGHSMGGLISHRACHLGAQEGRPWVDAVRTVIALGAPHLGAPLAKSVPPAEWLLTRRPVSAPLARVLAGRSAGIRDLHRGALPDPLLPRHISYRVVAATLTRDPHHPLGWLIGDGMVRPASALVAGRGHRLGRVGHQGLLTRPEVYERVRAWLAAG